MHMDLAWNMSTVWLVHCADKKQIELLKLTTVTAVYLIANVGGAKLPSCTVAISHQQHFLHFDSVFFIQHCVAMAFSDALFACEIKQEWTLENMFAEIYLIAGPEPLYCTQYGKSSTRQKTNLAHF